MDLTPSSSSITSRRIRPLKPLIYSQLITSTPDSYQASKRVKGLLGYSEHYKGPRIANATTDKGFPLQSRDYRKARELTLELWSPFTKHKYLEKFLKSLKGIQNIRIKAMGKSHRQEKENLKGFWKALLRIHWLNRVHIDFRGERRYDAIPSLVMSRSRKPLPKLMDLAITVDGKEIFHLPASFLEIGFDFGWNSISVKDPITMEKLMRRTPKFDQLDTIRIETHVSARISEEFLDGIAFVISKLPSFKELDFDFLRDLHLPMKQTFNVFDTLAKAPDLEIFRMGIRMDSIAQISMIKHPVFKTKSLKKLHLSLFIYGEITPKDIDEILDLLQGMPSLYELYLDFSKYLKMDDEIAEGLMRKISEMMNLRKLKIEFEYQTPNLSAKTAGNIIRQIFTKMVFLEELDLQLPKNGVDFTGVDIQGLRRLVKVGIRLRECEYQMEKSVKEVIGLLGRCLRLRELELDLSGSVYDFTETPTKLFETLEKLKGLQVLKLYIVQNWTPREVSVELLKDLMVIFSRMRNLQDWELNLGIGFLRLDEQQDLFGLSKEAIERRKYRFFSPGPRIEYALQNSFF